MEPMMSVVMQYLVVAISHRPDDVAAWQSKLCSRQLSDTAAHSDDSHSPHCIKLRLLYIFPPIQLLAPQGLVVHQVHGLMENLL